MVTAKAVVILWLPSTVHLSDHLLARYLNIAFHNIIVATEYQ